MLFALFFFFRMDWPELLDHPFWTQVLKEDENLEEEEDENDNEEVGTEEKNGREGVVSASSRYVDIISFAYILKTCCSFFTAFRFAL